MTERAIIDVLSKVKRIPDVKSMTSIEAIAVIGSRARGEYDENSDLDLLAIVTKEVELGTLAQQFARYIGPVLLMRGPVFVRHFGYSTTMILQDLTVCQVNFNYAGEAECNEMRAKSRIIFDRTGNLRRLVTEAQMLEPDLSNVFRENFIYFWIRLLLAKRSLDRGELWRATYYLSDARHAMLQLMHLRQHSYSAWTSPHSPATRFEQRVRSESIKELAPSLPSYSPQDINRCIQWCASWFDIEARRCEWYGVVSTRTLEAAQLIMRETNNG
jgi:predicted nucleotidyltransferase